ncbi:MAG TPA: hypothetical protein VGO53_14280, partial [Steroidobacteraceae bacterium]|nr:hypothetical protein [Steroidobacteraceae bacterium]
VATRLEARSFAFPEVSLKPGTHVFRIEESRGREFQSTFEVVTSAPVAPEDLNATSATLGTLAQTMWLAEQEEGAWRLESVKRLQPLIVERQLLAARMADAFLWSEERDPGMSSLQ